MTLTVDLHFGTKEAAEAARLVLRTHSAVTATNGIEISALEIRPILGAKKSAFALRISFEFALGIASGVAGNAAYEAIKDALAGYSAPATTSVPTAQPDAQPAMPVIQVNGTELQLDPHTLAQAIDRSTRRA